MRLLGGLFSAAAALLILAAAALYGVNIFVQRDGGEITAAVRKHFPGADVGYAAARVLVSWDGTALRAERLSVQDGNGNSLNAPEADFWLRPGGPVVVLRQPTLVIRGGNGGGKAGLPGGTWAFAAENAAVSYHNPDSGAAVSLQNINLQIKSEDGTWRAELAQPGALRAFAAVRQQNGVLAGGAYAEFFGRPPGLPEEWDMRATMRATLSGAAVSLVAGGIIGGDAGDIQWHGAGEWEDGALAATLAAASPELALFADAPAAAFFARGPLEYAAGKWQWRGRAVATGKDGKLRADIVLRGGGASSPTADVSVKLAGVPVASLWRYVSAPEAREWMSESLAEGTVERAHVRARGALPPEIVGMTAAFSGARVRIGGGWPDAENLNGILAARDDNIYAGGEGKIAGAVADNISVQIALADEPGVQIAARFYRAPVAEYLAAARQLPPTRDNIDKFVREVSLSGGARASVFVALPFAAPDSGTFLARVSLAGNGEIRTEGAPPFLRPSGIAEIDGNGARATVLGVFDGNPATLFVGGENITLRGRMAAKRAAFAADFAEAPVDGEANFEMRRDAEGLAFLSDLRGVAVSLPPPLAKTAEEAATLSVHTDASGAHGELHLGENIFRAAFAEGGANIAINAPAMPPPKEGIYVHGSVSDAGDVGAWLAQGDGGGGKIAVSLLVVNSELFGVFHHYVLVRAPPPKNGARTIILKGEKADGTVVLDDGMFRADLSRLALGAAGGGGADVFSLTISVAVEHFSLGDADLGELQLLGEPANGGWVLRRAQLKNGANVLTVAGGYDGARTTIALSLDAPEVAGVLAALGQEGVISEGGAAAAGGLFWPDSPADFSLAALAGAVSLRAENLRYPHASDSGALSFLAVFSPQSLLRLGFTEIGKEGVRLNTMEGTVNFANGDALFKEFQMRSEDVDISLEGEADMETRTLKLSGRVRPGNRLLGAGSTASIGAGLIAVQPLSLAAGWFLGKLFERPISEIGAYNYTITGPWEAPVYSETGVDYTEPPLAP